MIYKRIEPHIKLKHLIECYWIIEDQNNKPVQQKIIPDGYAEIIFHYGDPYKINLHGKWELQAKALFAGQISRHFYLENTGQSGILGIKLRPTAMYNLFKISQDQYTNKVLELSLVTGNKLDLLNSSILSSRDHDKLTGIINNWFLDQNAETAQTQSSLDKIVDFIIENHGMVSVSQMSELAQLGERQLQVLFKKQVGLSPKLFARIIRFNYIFQLVEQNNQSWSNLAYEAAYFDQSHFIKNFKDFTGENPTEYAFDKQNLANFFLKKK